MNELENQIPAQDCELEYWLHQAENYAEVQIPADDLRAIIARTYAAVNALPELLERVKRLEGALETIANPATYSHSLPSCCQHTFDDACELFSDIARAALNQETKP